METRVKRSEFSTQEKSLIDTSISKHAQLMKQCLDRVIDEIKYNEGSAQRSGSDGTLLFFGNQQDAIPRLLITDPSLDPTERMAWQILRVCIANPANPSFFPTQEVLGNHLGVSRPIVSRCLHVLRISRWMTQCTQIRGESGKFRQSVYGLHDEPLNLADTLYLDPEYLSYLDQCAANPNSRIRKMASEALRFIDIQVKTGFDVFRPRGQLEQTALRLNTYILNDQRLNPPCKESLHGENESKDKNTEKSDQTSNRVKNLDMVEKCNKNNDPDRVKNLDVVVSSETGGNSPCKESLHGEIPQHAYAYAVCCSSNIILNTTTTDRLGAREGLAIAAQPESSMTFPAPSPIVSEASDQDDQPSETQEGKAIIPEACPVKASSLRFPPCLTKSEQRAALFAIGQLNDQGQKQYALDYLEDRVKAGLEGISKPVRNKLRYLQKIANGILTNSLEPSSYGLRPEPVKPKTPEELEREQAEAKRREHEGWLRQMKQYGVSVDPNTGLPSNVREAK